MKISDGANSPGNFPPIASPNSLPDFNSHLIANSKLQRRRNGKGVVFVAGTQRKKHAPSSGRRSGLATPLLLWKFEDRDLSVAGDDAPSTGSRMFRRMTSEAVVSVSARKLAAGLWHLAAEVTCGGVDGGKGSQCGSLDALGFEPGTGHAKIKSPSYQQCREYGFKRKDLLQSNLSSSPKSRTFCELQSSLPVPKSVMEGATKWDPGYSKASNQVYGFSGHMKLVENQQVATISVVSALQTELVHAQTRICELETAQQLSKKKVEHHLRKIHDERTAWMRRERHRVRAILDDLKDELSREKRNCQRMEIMNSKLLNDLADVKLSAKQFMQDYEKEREARQLLEEACNELAKKIVEDKVEVEALKSESVKICEEVEEERKMLQMAELWREERVQMKLVDVKLILEEKYCQLNNLIADLETFLKSRDVTMVMSEAKVIKPAASLVNFQDIKEFSYMPPKLDDIYSRIEELQNGQAKQREIDQCLNFSPSSHASEILGGNCDIYFNKNLVQMLSNGFTDHRDTGLEDTSCLESVTCAEDQGSSYTPDGSNCTVNRISRGSNISRSGTEHGQNTGQESLNSEISEICFVSTKQLKKKALSTSKLWRSYPTNGDVYKTISVESSQRPSNGSASHIGTVSPEIGLGEAGLGHGDLLGPRGSPDSGNPHITRGMKGCIEWPRGIQRASLKAKLLEARVESQKTQLRSIFKQKS